MLRPCKVVRLFREVRLIGIMMPNWIVQAMCNGEATEALWSEETKSDEDMWNGDAVWSEKDVLSGEADRNGEYMWSGEAV